MPLSKVIKPWCSGYHYCTTSFKKAWIQVLRRFKSCSRRVGDSRWWGSLTMVPAGNKAKRLSSVNHTTKIIHHHHHQLSTAIAWISVGVCIKWNKIDFVITLQCRQESSSKFHSIFTVLINFMHWENWLKKLISFINS